MLSIDQNGDIAVRQHLYGLAAKHDYRDAVPTVRGHCDQVTAILVRRIDNGAVRMLVLDMDHSAANAGCRCGIVYLCRVFRR